MWSSLTPTGGCPRPFVGAVNKLRSTTPRLATAVRELALDGTEEAYTLQGAWQGERHQAESLEVTSARSRQGSQHSGSYAEKRRRSGQELKCERNDAAKIVVAILGAPDTSVCAARKQIVRNVRRVFAGKMWAAPARVEQSVF